MSKPLPEDPEVKFLFGSDAHTPKDLSNAIEIFKLAIDTLSLTESDKFYI